MRRIEWGLGNLAGRGSKTTDMSHTVILPATYYCAIFWGIRIVCIRERASAPALQAARLLDCPPSRAAESIGCWPLHTYCTFLVCSLNSLCWPQCEPPKEDNAARGIRVGSIAVGKMLSILGHKGILQQDYLAPPPSPPSPDRSTERFMILRGWIYKVHSPIDHPIGSHKGPNGDHDMQEILSSRIPSFNTTPDDPI
jgi:hypothetical protein